MSIGGSKSGNMVHLTAMVRAQFCTAVGSGCSSLLGNDYSYAEDASKSFHGLKNCRSEDAARLASI
jgi:hypothetical protein